MSEIEPLKAGKLVEPIVFEPKRNIRLSRSTYKVNSYIDFRPYQDSFKKFETYIHRFSRDLQDPDYVGALVNMHRIKEENYEYIQKRGKPYFGPTTCRGCKRNPQLTLPEDPNINIWNYCSIMKVTSVIMENFLLVILTIPLADQSLVMNLYRIHNLPALHPELHVQFQYQLEGEYLAIMKDKQYAALPTAQDI